MLAVVLRLRLGLVCDVGSCPEAETEARVSSRGLQLETMLYRFSMDSLHQWGDCSKGLELDWRNDHYVVVSFTYFFHLLSSANFLKACKKISYANWKPCHKHTLCGLSTPIRQLFKGLELDWGNEHYVVVFYTCTSFPSSLTKALHVRSSLDVRGKLYSVVSV